MQVLKVECRRDHITQQSVLFSLFDTFLLHILATEHTCHLSCEGPKFFDTDYRTHLPPFVLSQSLSTQPTEHTCHRSCSPKVFLHRLQNTPAIFCVVPKSFYTDYRTQLSSFVYSQSHSTQTAEHTCHVLCIPKVFLHRLQNTPAIFCVVPKSFYTDYRTHLPPFVQSQSLSTQTAEHTCHRSCSPKVFLHRLQNTPAIFRVVPKSFYTDYRAHLPSFVLSQSLSTQTTEHICHLLCSPKGFLYRLQNTSATVRVIHT